MQALDKFHKVLSEVDLLLEETRKALDDSQQVITAIDRAKHLSRANAFARSGMVLLSGHFEGFLKDILTEFACRLNSASIRLEFVPIELVETILSAILKECESGKEIHREKLQLIVTGKNVISIDSTLLSETGGNPKVDVIDKIGLPSIIDALSQQDYEVTTYQKKSQLDSSLKDKIKSALSNNINNSPNIDTLETEIFSLIEKKWQPKTKRRSVGYVAVIENLLDKRNRIAHGQSSIKITAQELEDSLKDIKKLASGLNSALDSQLNFICSSSTP